MDFCLLRLPFSWSFTWREQAFAVFLFCFGLVFAYIYWCFLVANFTSIVWDR